MSCANDKQIDGNHYKTEDGKLQHWDWVTDNNLGYLEGCATKYLCRCNRKHPAPTIDMRKAIHYLEKLIEKEPSARSNTADSKQSSTVVDLCEAYDLDARIFAAITTIRHWKCSPGTTGLSFAIELIREYLK